MRLIAFIVVAFSTVRVLAAPISVDAGAIIRVGENHLRGQSLQATLTMTVKRPTFTRKLRVRTWTSGNAKALVEILEPLKEEGISSLRVEQQMWNYLPKTDQVVRVPTSLMLQSWMGSDFTNDDLMKMSRLSSDYDHLLLREEKLANGEPVLVIQCQPRAGAPVVWGKIIYWARVSDKLPVKEEYYDDAGKLVRTLTLTQFEKMDDRLFPRELSIHKAEQPEESTTIVYEKVLFDRNVGASIFDRDHLRRTSQLGKNTARGWFTLPLAVPAG